jgi:hypothetical protein
MTFASGRTTLRVTPHERPVHWPSPRARSWCSDGLQPRRHPGRRPEAPGRPRPRPQDRHRARHLHSATSGLTVRCFGDDHCPDGWCPARVARPVSAGISGPDGCRAGARTPVTSADTGGPCGSHRGHGNWSGARPATGLEPLLPQATAASKRGWYGRCPVGMATPTAHAGTGVDCRRHRRTLPLWPSAVPSRSGHRGRTAASGVCPAAAVARGTGRRVGGRCWDAASAGGRGRAGRSGDRGAGRGRRSSPVG